MLENLFEILEKDLFLDVSAKNNLTVKESKIGNVKNSLNEVTITNVPKKSVAFTLDYFTKDRQKLAELKRKYGSQFQIKLSWLINVEHPHANKKSDFVIFSPDENGVCRIMIGELKSSLGEYEYRNQLINSHIYVKYILDLMREYHQANITPLFRLVLLTKSNDYGRFFAKSRASQNQNYHRGKLEPYMVNLQAPSGIGSIDYEAIFNDCSSPLSYG